MTLESTAEDHVPETFRVGETVGFYSEENRIPEKPLPVQVIAINGNEVTVTTATGRKMTFISRESDNRHVAPQGDTESETADRITHFDFGFPEPNRVATFFLILIVLIIKLPLSIIGHISESIASRKRRKILKYVEKIGNYNDENRHPFIVGEKVLLLTQGDTLFKPKYPFCQAKVTKIEGEEITVSYHANMGILSEFRAETFKPNPQPNPAGMYVSAPLDENSTTIPNFLFHRPPVRLGEYWTLFS